MIAGLIPAAGASRRMGRDKRRVPYRGGVVIEATVACLLDGGLDPVIVVLEPDSPCRDLPGLARVTLAENPDPDRGMLSSIRCGLDAMPDGVEAVALLPGDHPFVPAEAVASLTSCFREQRPPLLAPRYGDSERRGHPLFIRADLFDEARACDDDVGLRQLVRRRASEVLEVALDLPGADDDLDHPEDLKKLR